jgi:hypothetical protein
MYNILLNKCKYNLYDIYDNYSISDGVVNRPVCFNILIFYIK